MLILMGVLRHIFFLFLVLLASHSIKAQCNLTTNILTAFNCINSTGMASITPINGTPPYTVTSSPPGVNSLTVANLPITVYNVVVTDANNCSSSQQIIYTNRNSSLNIVFTASNSIGQYIVSCVGKQDGSATAKFNGGAPPFTYTWSNGSNASFINNLAPGIYSVTIGDAEGCIATNTVEITEPLPLVTSLSHTTIVCFGGTLTSTLQTKGGTPPFASYTVNGAPVQGKVITNLNHGTHTIGVTDSKGCIGTTTVFVPPSTASSVSINFDNSKTGICPGSTTAITPTISGGDGNYSYNWLPINSHASSIFVENVSQPFYTLTVKDGCGIVPAVRIFTINLFDVTQPLFKTSEQQGCAPFCTRFINLTPKSSQVIWEYGDTHKEQGRDTVYHCYSNPGSYHLKITLRDSNSCLSYYTYNDVIKVNVSPLPNFNSDPAIVTLNNSDNVFIKNTSTNAKEFEWQVNGKFYSLNKNINYSFKDTGCYVFKLIARNGNGCELSSTKDICVFEGFNFYMPSSFSPNGDELNDFLSPKGTGWLFKNYSFEVYNRWGKRIFETQDVFKSWDGGVSENVGSPEITRSNGNDVYTWRVMVTDNQQKEHVFRGMVTVVK